MFLRVLACPFLVPALLVVFGLGEDGSCPPFPPQRPPIFATRKQREPSSLTAPHRTVIRPFTHFVQSKLLRPFG